MESKRSVSLPPGQNATPPAAPTQRRATAPAASLSSSGPVFRSSVNVAQYYQGNVGGGSAMARLAHAKAVDPFAATAYRGIPLGAVQARTESDARGPLRSMAQRPPIYRSLSASMAGHSPYGQQPTYRSINVGAPASSSLGFGLPGMGVGGLDMPGMHRPASVGKGSIGASNKGAGLDPFAPSMATSAPKQGVDPFTVEAITNPAVGVQPAVLRAAERAAIVPPAMPQPPFYLEKSHFYSQQAVPQLVESIKAELQKNEVDFSFNPVKCKWKIDMYVNNHHLSLRGRLYSVGEGQGLSVVEFNRRKGESFVFCSWYREMLRSLVSSKLVCDCAGASMSLSAAFPKAVRAVRTVPVPAVHKDCLQPLLEMASTSFAETQAEAAREVANLSNRAENKSQIVAAGFLKPLIALLQSHDSDVHRCAAVAMGNLSAGATDASVVASLQSVAPHAVEALCGMLKRDSLNELGVVDHTQAPTESQRASARALANLLGACRGEGAAAAEGLGLEPQNKELIASFHQGCSCPRLKAHCGRALRMVDVA